MKRPRTADKRQEAGNSPEHSPAANVQDVRAEDLGILARVRAGDRQAFRELVDKYQQRAYAIAFQVLRRHEDAQDVVQESFVKAYLSLDQFKGNSAFYTWFYRIVFNMAIDLKRKRSRKSEASVSLDDDTRAEFERQSESPTVARIEAPHEALVRREQARQLNTVLDRISEEHRSVIVLREVDGLAYDQIAQVLGISKGTVMSRLHYARKRLQGLLKELLFESDDRGSTKMPTGI